MKMLTATEAAYIAGILDGEGTIVITFREPRKTCREISTNLNIQVVVVMTSKETIDWLGATTGTEANVYFTKSRNSKHRSSWAWRLPIGEARELLPQCLPYMVTKKRNAEILIELIDIRRKSTKTHRNWERQYELAVENQLLNKRG